MNKCFVDSKASIRTIVLLFYFFFVPGIGSAELNTSSTPISSLEQIEPLICYGPEVLAALSANSKSEALEALERERAGAKYFLGITHGYNNEPASVTSEDKIRYNKFNVTGGLNFPLLGTLQKEKIVKLQAETATLESKHHSSMLALNNLIALRKAYTSLWIEQQKEEIAKRFLNTEAETIHILQERQAQGLVLMADSLELLAVYHDIQRDIAASKLRQRKALNLISIVTGREWNSTEKLKAPSLPSVDGKEIDLTAHPEVKYQSSLVSQYEKLFAAKQRTEREANLSIGLTASKTLPGTLGNGAYITFSMTEPVKGTSAQNQAKQAANSDLIRAKEEEKFIRLKLEGQATEALATAAYAATEVNARTSHLIVMAESIRERMLRRAVMAGDTFEQLQYSKSQYYRTALETLSYEEMFLQSTIDVISYVYPRDVASKPAERISIINEADDMRKKLFAAKWLDSKNIQDDKSVPLDFSSIPNIKAPVIVFGSIEKMSAAPAENKTTIPLESIRNGVYVWNAEPFLQRDTRIAALNEIINAGFSRILISFTPKQISTLLSAEGKDELDALLHTAKSKKVRIDLMLGDPLWAKGDHRGELLLLIKQLQNFDFKGIHLDIEPDSLADVSASGAEFIEGLADTVKTVKQITTLPVSISIHPRYLEGDFGILAREKLLPLGMEEVVVMIYSNKPYRAAQRMAAIMKANPDVPFSLAQSVEKNISSTESYADYTQQEFDNVMHILKENLASYGLKGIFIQEWEDYKKGEVK